MDKIDILYYNNIKAVNNLEIFRGMITEWSDKTSDRYITVNNFGYYKSISRKISTQREKGRSDYQIMYLDKGSGTFFLDNKWTEIPCGTVIIYRPEERQEYSIYLNSDYYWIHFSGTEVENLLEELKLNGTVFNTGDFLGFKEIFEKMIKDNSVSDMASSSLLSSHLITLLSLTSRKLHTSDNSIHKVIEKMQTDFTNRLTNEEYAKICGISTYHFIRKFKKETGLTPLQYKTKIIVEKATDLLSTTNLNVSEIARMLGFEDSLYFSRVFKKETGVSPKKYNITK